MDRVSAILIFGIMALVMVSSYMIFDTWFQKPGYDEEILTFNDDTSVTNSSTETLWVRAKIDEEPASSMSLRINENSWIDGEDGWHYYAESLAANQHTAPFAKPGGSSSADAKPAAIASFRVKVEAVEQARLSRVPEDGREAFLLLKRETQEAEPILL